MSSSTVALAVSAQAAQAWSGFLIEWTDAGGAHHREPLRDVGSMPFEAAAAVRSFSSYRGQRNWPGLWWSATTGAHIGYESWLERDQAMLLDFDCEVVGFAAEPFWLLFTGERGPRCPTRCGCGRRGCRTVIWPGPTAARLAAAKPVIIPETIVCDRGAVFLSEMFVNACARLGISVQPAHPRTPTDKPRVERTFSSINTLFCQYVAGYTGRDVTRRGTDVDERAVWPIGDLEDLLDEWVIAGWQRRPHDGLRHTDLARTALSPNEMYAALVASAGYLPLALNGEDYLKLLPVAWRRITAEGLQGQVPGRGVSVDLRVDLG